MSIDKRVPIEVSDRFYAEFAESEISREREFFMFKILELEAKVERLSLEVAMTDSEIIQDLKSLVHTERSLKESAKSENSELTAEVERLKSANSELNSEITQLKETNG
jgi:chromosome segregation ATPase